MADRSNRKKEPWRIILAVISMAFIVFMWVKKDIADLYSTLPKEQLVPLIATSVAVSLLKIGAIAGVGLALRWIIAKIVNKVG